MAEEPVKCPKCRVDMEPWVGDYVSCPNSECKVTVLPMAQFRAKRVRDQLASEGKLRHQQPTKLAEAEKTLAAAMAAA